jgi:WD40 repeat protein
MELGKTRSSTRKTKRIRREMALPSVIITHTMGWLGTRDIASAARVNKAFARGCESEMLWREQYRRAFGQKKRGGRGIRSALGPPCAENRVIYNSESESTLWRARFARRFGIERNWLSFGDVGDRFASHTFSGHTILVFCVLVWWEQGLMFSGSLDNTIRVWSLESGTCLHVLEGHTNGVLCLAGDSETNTLVSDSETNTLVSGSIDKTVRVWDSTSGECLYTLRGHTYWVWSIALIPNKVIVSGGGNGEIKMWCGEEGKLLKTMTGGGTVDIWSLVSDGKRIVSGDCDGDIRIFNKESGACTEVLFHAPKGVSCLALRGDILVAGYEDGKLRSWDLSVGSGSICEFEDVKADGMRSVSFQKGPMRVVTRDCREQVRLWDVEEARCLAVLPCTVTRGSIGQQVAADWYRLVYAHGKDIKMLDLSL